MVDRIELRWVALPPLAELEQEWRALETIARPSFFTSWYWIGTLLAVLPVASRPTLLRGLAGKRTVALALLGASATRRRWLIRSRGLYVNETGDPRFDAMTIEHNSLLAAAQYQAAVSDALVDWFAKLRDEADELYLRGSLSPWSRDAVEGRGLRRIEVAVPSYSVDLRRLAQSGGKLYPVLSRNARQQLHRAMRRFECFGELQLTEATTIEEGFAYFAAMKELHCAWWECRGRAHAFSHPFFEPFHRQLIETSLPSGGTQLLRATAGERIIGYLYNFRLGERIYAYQSGFADFGGRDRPGAVTHALAIRHAFRTGARVYDFMAGHNRLKESFSTHCEPMLWQTIQQPRLVFRLEHLARTAKRGVEGMLVEFRRRKNLLLRYRQSDREIAPGVAVHSRRAQD